MIDGILETLTLTRLDAIMIFVIYPLIFVGVWKLFETVIFAPYMALFEAREQATSGAEHLARAQIEEAEALELQFQEGIAEARAEAFQKKLRRLSQASREASEIVAKAENEAAQEIQSERDQLETARQVLQNEVLAEADSLVEEVVTRLKKPAGIAGSSV